MIQQPNPTLLNINTLSTPLNLSDPNRVPTACTDHVLGKSNQITIFDQRQRSNQMITISPDAVQCSYSDCVRPSMTRMSPWSSRIEEETSPGSRRRTLNFTEFPKLKLTMSSGEFCGPNKGSFSLCQGIHDPEPEYRFRFTPLAHPSYHTRVTRRVRPSPTNQ